MCSCAISQKVPELPKWPFGPTVCQWSALEKHGLSPDDERLTKGLTNDQRPTII